MINSSALQGPGLQMELEGSGDAGHGSSLKREGKPLPLKDQFHSRPTSLPKVLLRRPGNKKKVVLMEMGKRIPKIAAIAAVIVVVVS